MNLITRRATAIMASVIAVTVLAGCGSYSDRFGHDYAVQTATEAPVQPSAAPVDAPVVPSAPESTPVEATPDEAPADVCLSAATPSDRFFCITVAEPVYDKSYNRDEQFGKRWLDFDGNGCTSREDILVRDMVDVTLEGQCKVVTGVLHDTYTGKVVNFVYGRETSADVQIDHIFPLAMAWYGGAKDWTQDERLRFANDFNNLKAVDGKENSSKSAAGPSDWTPVEDQCGYATSFVNVAYEYKLAVPPADAQALGEILTTC